MRTSAEPRWSATVRDLFARIVLLLRLIYVVLFRLPAPAVEASSRRAPSNLAVVLCEVLLRTPDGSGGGGIGRKRAGGGHGGPAASGVGVGSGRRRSDPSAAKVTSGGSDEDTPLSGDDFGSGSGGGGGSASGGGGGVVGHRSRRVSDDALRSASDGDAGGAASDGGPLSGPAAAPILSARASPSSAERRAGASASGKVPRETSVLAVDVGGTRTKFLLIAGNACTRLPPAPTARIWQNPELAGDDKFEPSSAPHRMRSYLRECGVELASIGRLAFSVPGTVDLTADKGLKNSSVVKNTPSMSPRFRGFDFKEAFRDVNATAKVSAYADNLAAALGVACQHTHLRSALVVVLGSAPAVATLFRDPSGKGKYIETAIWQSWVWFTKIKLDDPHGYCGGLKVTRNGVTLKPSSAAKIPHHQARIRFALDDATWRRLRGCADGLPDELQAHLSEEDATAVWVSRLQAAVNALAERFHSIYGPPQEVHVLGGNASRCHGRVTSARYVIPDATTLLKQVPVIIPPDDAAQQLLHMSGLVYASCFKLKQVTAPGQDPLARGWTRGGEIYLWVAKGVKAEHEIAWPTLDAVRDAARDAGASVASVGRREELLGRPRAEDGGSGGSGEPLPVHSAGDEDGEEPLVSE